MSEMPSMPFFVDDYEAATSHLSLEEDGLYNRLLRLCWRTAGCSVPDDKGWLMRHLRLSSEDFDRVAAPVIAEFFTVLNGRLSQKRQQREFAYVKDVREKRKAAGKKGGLGGVVSKPLKNNGSEPSKPQAPHLHLHPTIEEPPLEVTREREPTPYEILKEGMDEETAKAVISHRKAIKAPLNSALAARGLLKAYREFPGGVQAAVEMHVTNGWRGFKRDYWDKQPRGSPPSQRRTGLAALTEEFKQELAEDGYLDQREKGRDHDDDARLPLLAIGHHR